MADQSFADALNAQISNEFAASQQYIGAAVYYDSETLPRLAAFFYRQAVEERNHAMIMVQYLLDTDEEVRIPDIESKRTFALTMLLSTLTETGAREALPLVTISSSG